MKKRTARAPGKTALRRRTARVRTKAPPRVRKKRAPSASRRGGPAGPAEFGRLRDALREAQETLDAIRSGEVDAVVVRGEEGNRIYSLRGAEHPYRIYVEQMQEGAVTASSDGLILYCNQRFADMAGLPLERAIGSSVQQHLPNGSWARLSAVFRGNGAPVKHPGLMGAADRPVPVSLTASRFPLDGQDVMCLVVTDLSEQQRKGELERANVAKDAFLAALSHELRTPLNPVLLVASEAAADPELPEKVRADFEMIRKNIELEARLIDDLLDLTHVSSGKMKLQRTWQNLHDILHDAVATVRAEAERKGIGLKLDFAAGEHGVTGDAVRLQQIFWNLLKNAVKFTPEGGSILFTTEPGAARKTVVVRVRDTGIGMTAAELERAFSAFSQGEHAEGGSHRFGGMGLGLAISKMLVELHSGRIEAFSEGRGRGAMFIIELPLSPAPASVSAGAVSRKPPVRPGAAPAGRARILLVEDHDATRTALTHLLTRRNHEVRAAASAAEALAHAGEGTFDLLISDIGLPDRNGYELMAELKERYRLRGIALTGYGMEQDIGRSLQAGFERHLTKPVHAQDMDEVLAFMLKATP